MMAVMMRMDVEVLMSDDKIVTYQDLSDDERSAEVIKVVSEMYNELAVKMSDMTSMMRIYDKMKPSGRSEIYDDFELTLKHCIGLLGKLRCIDGIDKK